MQDILKIIATSPGGISAGELERQTGFSRATVNRRLKDAIARNLIVPNGEGAARVYFDADLFRPVRAYFDAPSDERPVARFREELLDFHPALDLSKLQVTKGFSPLEKKDLVQFLVDFSCASSVLEGGSYSLLDTQALIEYGEIAQDKPLADAYLVLNHKNAFEYLYDHVSLDSIFEVQKRLTDDHERPELKSALHFLGKELQGAVRNYENETVRITNSSYLPPLRPGTGYVRQMLDRILEISAAIGEPLESAFYLLTRLPYLQPFADGNKRTSRAICNVPLLKAGLPPISFLDFKSRKDYIISLLAFYELGDTTMASAIFTDAYLKSCKRLGKPARNIS